MRRARSGHLLGPDPGIALFGYANFVIHAPELSADHRAVARALLKELGIPHTDHTDTDTVREHRWDPGWLPEALDEMTRRRDDVVWR